MHDLVVRNGTIIDGTGSPPFAGDVAIDGATLTAIGTVGLIRRSRTSSRNEPGATDARAAA